jgi:hypothetical protein
LLDGIIDCSNNGLELGDRDDSTYGSYDGVLDDLPDGLADDTNDGIEVGN